MNRIVLPCRREGLLFLVLLLLFPAVSSQGFQSRSQPTWAFRDGSMTLSRQEDGYVFAFPYIPFLNIHPVWAPALPRSYGGSPRDVIPLLGLGGTLRMGRVEESGRFDPFSESNLEILERTPFSAQARVVDSTGSLDWIAPIDSKGLRFRYQNSGEATHTLRFEIEGSPYKNVWATPGRKMSHDWGYNRWEAREDKNAFIHTYSNPIDATRTPCTALWFDRAWSRHELVKSSGFAPALCAWIEVDIPPRSALRFGFLHADQRRELFHSIEAKRKTAGGMDEAAGEWKAWIENSLRKIEEKIAAATEEVEGASSSLGSYREAFIEILTQTRLLFLSNGGVLTRPMTPTELPLNLRDQAVGLNHWIGMGLEFPFLEKWRDLARYNPYSERSISIETLSGERTDRLFRGQTAVIASPDPNNPPSKRLMDILLGYVISGGKVTLVDGVFGFEDLEGWWKEEGFRDPADYALVSIGIEHDPASRRILDKEGLDDETNTFCIGMGVYLEGDSDSTVEIATVTPGGGYLVVYPRNEREGEGVYIERGRLGDEVFVPFTPSEDKILAASYDSRAVRNGYGLPTARSISGEGYVAYRLPESATVACALQLNGKWKVAWSEDPPKTHHTWVKKAFQEWYLRELLTARVSRLAHPVVYDATWGARVFDVTPTTLSPILYRQVGRGSFVWVGAPRDFFLQGSDTGTDRQNSLRNDQTYDLLRMTLALHDREHGGGQQASASPARGWSEGWNRSTRVGPRSDHAYFAWTPTRFLGGGAGSLEYWTWAMDCFHQALEQPGREGRRMAIGNLATRAMGDSKDCVDLYLNACRHALYADMSAQCDREGLEWWRIQTEKRAKAIENDLLAVLDLGSATPAWGRVVEDGSAQEVLPFEAFLPEAVWTVSEIRGVRFPGGEAARGRAIKSLLENVSAIRDPRSRAAMATLPGARVEELLDGVFPNKDFDLAVALPAMRAIALERSR